MANQDCKRAMFGDAGSSPAQGTKYRDSSFEFPPDLPHGAKAGFVKLNCGERTPRG